MNGFSKFPAIKRLLAMLFVIAWLQLSLSGCQGNAIPQQDVNLLYTAGAQTVIARLTAAAKQGTPLPPTGTGFPPTANSSPTNEISSEISPTITIPTTLISVENPNGSTPTPETAQTTISNIPLDKCQWMEQDPPDNASIAANTGFSTTWVLKNNGGSTWNKQYRAVWYNTIGSDRIGPGQPIVFDLTNDVAPNEVYRLKVEMQASLVPGKYYSLWALQNSFGTTFCSFDLTINVK
jgi:hypothetical protein